MAGGHKGILEEERTRTVQSNCSSGKWKSRMSTLFQDLIFETGIRDLELRRIITRAPRRYKFYTILKRSGGERLIAQPAREVKLVQRALIKVLLERLPIHSAATAYRQGLSIRDNAKPHAQNGPILKLDFKEFFPSIQDRDWENYCRRTGALSDENEIYLTSRLLFCDAPGKRGLRLAIGAPSSPMLSNILMSDFDSAVKTSLETDKVTYTRYADDMTFSAPRTGFLTNVIACVGKIIRGMDSPRLKLNKEKTTYVTKKYRRSVTGLTLSNDGQITIGRDKKRRISATVHHAQLGKLAATELQILAGVLAYVNAVEPSFLDTLRKKYGADLIERVRHTVLLGSRPPRHNPPLAPC
jgi:RNA-directed DNA polymerase